MIKQKSQTMLPPPAASSSTPTSAMVRIPPVVPPTVLPGARVLVRDADAATPGALLAFRESCCEGCCCKFFKRV